MKLSAISYLFIIVFLFSSFYTQDLLATTSSTTTLSPKKTKVKKLKGKEKIVLWMLRRKIRKVAKRQAKLRQVPTDTTLCATIFLQSGFQLKAKILEISDHSVSFFRCGESDSLALSKLDIDKIMLHDGVKLFEQKWEYKKRKRDIPNRRLAIVSIIFTMTALPLVYITFTPLIALLLIAALLGLISLTIVPKKEIGIARFASFIGLTMLAHRLRRKYRQ